MLQELISFVVIAYNEQECIGQTLSSIAELENLDQYEIIVVDDGSTDHTADIVREFEEVNGRVRLVRLVSNRGRGYARSRGIAEASGGILATVDADIVLPTHWLVRLREALSDHHAVGGTAVPDGDVAYIYRRFQLMPRPKPHTIAVTGSNALYRREVFNKMSFDPHLRDGEDVALNQASKLEEFSFATVPGLFVRHEEAKTFGHSIKWLFLSGKGATRQLLRYHRVRQPDVAFAALFISLGAGVILAVREEWMISLAVPLGCLVSVAALHLNSRFELRGVGVGRLVSAVAANSALLASYFAGRIVGFSAVWRGRRVSATAARGLR